ncbi:LysM peptidoglycan-binding domain-containing protein [Paenibacillus lautus]|uniref:LysM peptidoglycan-binding domain-containing protein n=1 Tax=Paenibacillus lautus TaxID=1401 RepID=UPI003D2BE8E7
MSKYEIWLSFNNQKEGFQIPINPESISVSDGNKGNTYDIVSAGEINVIQNRSLSEYSFEGIFPGQKYPFTVASILLDPKAYVEHILKWMDSKRPIRFVYTSPTFEINTPASIESFEWSEVAGSPGDIEYSITLKKYVFYSAQKVKVQQKAGGSAKATKSKEKRPNDKQPPKTYKIVLGDSLWKIAKKTLGDGDRWPEIQKLNNMKDSDLKKLQVGKTLKIPQGGKANA